MLITYPSVLDRAGISCLLSRGCSAPCAAGTLPAQLGANGTWPLISAIDLAGNDLQGSIPDWPAISQYSLLPKLTRKICVVHKLQ